MMIVVSFLGSTLFVFTLALGENFKTKAWERICRRQLLLDKLSTRIHKSFLSTLRIAPIGRTIIEVKSTLKPLVVVRKHYLSFIV